MRKKSEHLIKAIQKYIDEHTKKNEDDIGTWLHLEEELEKKKITINPELNHDFDVLNEYFNEWARNRKEYDYIKNEYFCDCLEDDSRMCGNLMGCASMILEGAIISGNNIKPMRFPSTSKFWQLVLKAIKFEKKYKVTVAIEYRHGVLGIAIEDFINRRSIYLDVIKDGGCVKFSPHMLDGPGSDLRVLRNKYGIQILFSKINKISILDNSNTDNLLRSLSLKSNQYFPAVITYKSLKDMNKAFFLSIPKNTNLKETVNKFSKQITALHADFFRTKKGRPRTKVYKQSIFNQEFSIIRQAKKKFSLERACQETAQILNDKYGIKLSWRTLKRDYYPEYKKTYKKEEYGKKVKLFLQNGKKV